MRSLLIALAGLLALGRAASALTLTVSDAACHFVTAHQPSADAEYRPGVDIYGKPVAPADLPSGFAIDPLKELVIDITVDMAGRLTGSSPQGPYGSGSRLGQPPSGPNRRTSQPPSGPNGALPQPPSGVNSLVPQALYLGSGSVGYIVFEDGRLLFNGRPLQDPFEEELAALCRMARQVR